jgi:hypothetical protein
VQLGSPRRLKHIYRTNVDVARQVGQWQRLQRNKATTPFLLYSLGPSENHRQEHLQWDGLLLPIDHPHWRTHMPKNGHGCKCRVRGVTKRQRDRYIKDGIPASGTAQELDPATGLPTGRKVQQKIKPQTSAPTIETRRHVNKRTGEITYVPKGIDPGWDHNPGAARQQSAKRSAFAKKQSFEQALKAQAPRVPLPPPSLDEAINSGEEIAKQLGAHKETINAAAFRNTLHKRLHSEIGAERAVNVKSSGKSAQLTKQASKLYPASWIQAADEFGPLYTKAIKGRASYSTITAKYHGKRVRMSNFGIITAEANAGYLRSYDLRSTVHEFTHRLQAALPALDDIFQQLHRRRTQGDERKSLRNLTGNKGYGWSEVAKEDNYINPYFGREYDVDEGPTGALEVMTMTLERILAGSQEEFDNLRKNDPELFNLGIGVLFRYEPHI